MDSVKIKNPCNNRDLVLSFPEKDTCIGAILKTGKMWEGKMISKAILPLVKPGTTFIDCGAYIGTYSCCIAQAVPEADVQSFEMMPMIYEMLKKNINDNGLSNVTAHHQTLSNAEYSFNLPLRNYDVPDNYGYTAMQGFTLGNESVQTKRLDSFKFVKPVSFIKIDVEGHEPWVMLGAMETITRDRPTLMVECWDRNSYVPEWLYVCEKLRELGYTWSTYAGADILFTPNV